MIYFALFFTCTKLRCKATTRHRHSRAFAFQLARAAKRREKRGGTGRKCNKAHSSESLHTTSGWKHLLRNQYTRRLQSSHYGTYITLRESLLVILGKQLVVQFEWHSTPLYLIVRPFYDVPIRPRRDPKAVDAGKNYSRNDGNDQYLL